MEDYEELARSLTLLAMCPGCSEIWEAHHFVLREDAPWCPGCDAEFYPDEHEPEGCPLCAEEAAAARAERFPESLWYWHGGVPLGHPN